MRSEDKHVLVMYHYIRVIVVVPRSPSCGAATASGLKLHIGG